MYGPRIELPGGLLLKQFGKVAQYGGREDTDPRSWGVRVAIDRIEIDPRCDDGVPQPSRGHRLVLSVRAETSTEFRNAVDVIPSYFNFTTTSPDGITEAATSESYTCHDAKRLPYEFRPSAKYRGEVTLDTANSAGQVVLGNAYAWNY